MAEYDPASAVLRRCVHGPGVDEPILWYEGAGTTDRRWLHQDRQGSVIAWSNGSGTVSASTIYKYAPSGEPGDACLPGAVIDLVYSAGTSRPIPFLGIKRPDDVQGVRASTRRLATVSRSRAKAARTSSVGVGGGVM